MNNVWLQLTSYQGGNFSDQFLYCLCHVYALVGAKPLPLNVTYRTRKGPVNVADHINAC